MKIRKNKLNLKYGTNFGLPLAILPDWAFNQKGEAYEGLYPSEERQTEIVNLRIKHLEAKSTPNESLTRNSPWRDTSKLKRGTCISDYDPSKVDFSASSARLNLPPKMSPAEIRQAVRDVAEKEAAQRTEDEWRAMENFLSEIYLKKCKFLDALRKKRIRGLLIEDFGPPRPPLTPPQKKALEGKMPPHPGGLTPSEILKKYSKPLSRKKPSIGKPKKATKTKPR